MILWTIISLSVIHLTTQQQQCPIICTCDTLSYITTAICFDIPSVTLPTLRSLKVVKDMHTTKDGMLLHTPHLKVLDLSECNISLISTGTFNVANLTNLNLSHNMIKILDSNVFQSMVTLEVLCLEYNMLQEIHKDLFVELKNLQVLSLANNRLRSLPSWIPTSLRKLNVSFNEIRHVGRNNSQFQFQGEEFDINGNPIDTIDNWNWINTTKLHELRIDLSTVASSENITFDELLHLTLHSNGGSSLDKNTVQILKTMPKLMFFTLENFNVSSLEFFHSMTNLKYLTLKQILHSNATCLHQELLPLQEMHSLDLEGSPQLAEVVLQHWEGITFSSLEYISFRNCEIKSISTNDFSWYNGTINLQDNPLDCTCSDNWIAHNLKRIQSSKNTMCSSPEHMENQSIMFICKDEKESTTKMEMDQTNNTNSNNQTNVIQTEDNSKAGVVLFQIALIILAILAISLCIMYTYIHHTQLQLHRLETQNLPIKLQEVQSEDDIKSTQCPTKQ